MSWTKSFSFRLTLTSLVIFTISSALMFGSYYIYSVYAPKRSIQRAVDRDVKAYEQIYAIGGSAALVRALNVRERQPSRYANLHAFIGPDGRTISANIPTWPKVSGQKWLTIEADVYADGVEYDRLAFVRDKRFPNNSRLLLGKDIDQIDELEENLQEAILWLLGSSIILGLCGSLLIGRAISKRISSISETAATVMNGNLSGRIPTDESHDEFDRLGRTLNKMLDRIDVLFGSVRRVSDNVAHELRTPLARMLAHIEMLEQQIQSKDQPNLSAIAIEARRLQSIFDGLLRISRLEVGRYNKAVKSVKILTLLEDVIEYYVPGVETAGGSISLTDCSVDDIQADPDLLFQALANLLDNALKYGGSNPAIVVSAIKVGRDIKIEIVDSGPDIDENQIERFGERFFRGENALGLPGEGLGLALVRSVAEVHGGNFEIFRTGDLTVAKLILPDS